MRIAIGEKMLVVSSSEKTKRGDTGKYELTLRNAKGEVKVPIDVTVIGKREDLDGVANKIGVFLRSSG